MDSLEGTDMRQPNLEVGLMAGSLHLMSQSMNDSMMTT